MLVGGLCRSSISSLSLSLGLLGACSGADHPPRIGEPDWISEIPDAGDAGQGRQEAGTPDPGPRNHFDFIGFGQVLTPEMMCEVPDAGPILDIFTHTCTWSTPRQLTDRPGRQDRDPALVATGNPAAPVGLTWTGDQQILFQILDGQGAALNSEVPLSSALEALNSRLAYDGSKFGVVWSDRADPTRNIPTKVDFRLVDVQGVPGRMTNIVDAGSPANKATITATDAGWIVTWGDGRPGAVGLYGSILTADGTVSLGEQALQLSAQGAILPSVTWTGSDIAVAWHDNRDGNPEIYFGRFDGSLQLLESSGQAITQRDEASSEPTVITTDEGLAISWLDTLCGSVRVHLTILDAQGRWLIPEQIFTRGGATAASVAWDEDLGLLGLLWVLGDAAGRELQFQLLDKQANRVSDVTTIATDVLSSSENPQLIWTGEGFITAFEDAPSNDREIYVATGDCLAL